MTDKDQQPGIILQDEQGHEFSAEELTRHVNDTEFDINVLNDDGSQWEALDDYFHNAIKQFCVMVSMQIPKPFLGKDAQETEIFSTKAGIAAMDVCMKKLREGERKIVLSTDKPGQHEDLSSWYSEAIVKYMHTISLKVPEKFADEGEKKSNLAAIRAFNRIRRELVESVM